MADIFHREPGQQVFERSFRGLAQRSNLGSFLPALDTALLHAAASDYTAKTVVFNSEQAQQLESGTSMKVLQDFFDEVTFLQSNDVPKDTYWII